MLRCKKKRRKLSCLVFLVLVTSDSLLTVYYFILFKSLLGLIKFQLRQESEYPRDADQKGRAVIINIKEFMNERSRKGSEKDVASLCRLFELMKYDVTTYGNMEGNANFFKKEVRKLF